MIMMRRRPWLIVVLGSLLCFGIGLLLSPYIFAA